MHIEYDPNKSWRNIITRQLSFELVQFFEWETAITKQDSRFEYAEVRYVSIGYISKRLYFVCFTFTTNGIRVISFRKANKRECKYYEQQTAFNR